MVEIKELVVRAIIVEDGARPDKNQGSSQPTGALTAENRALLIEDCVRQVLAILERQTER